MIMFRKIFIPLLVSCAALALAVTPAMAESVLPEFGLRKIAVSARNQNGTPDVEAGSHPYSLNTTFTLNKAGPETGYLKDVKLELPPGFVGDPNATPRCTYAEFVKQEVGREKACSPETAVGVATVYLDKASLPEEAVPVTYPVYNLVPPKGVAAEFGFLVAQLAPVLLQTSVRTGNDYGLTTTVSNVNQSVIVRGGKVTIWGVPASPEHNLIRGECEREVSGPSRLFETIGNGVVGEEAELENPIHSETEPGWNQPVDEGLPEPTAASEENGGCKTQAPQIPLLTNPTSCGVSRTATFSVDSWEEQNNFSGSRKKSVSLPELQGCERLDFSPTVGVSTDGSAGSTPTGLNVDLHVPQETALNPVGLTEADVKNTVVTLPAGMQLSPSAADGLQGCSEAQVGFERYEELDGSGVQSAIFKPKVYNEATGQEEASLCPDASKIANVHIKTPLLEGELEGSMFLASPQNFAGFPQENPFSSLFAMYLVAEEPKTGVLVKLPGRVELGEPGVNNGLAPGQVRTTFADTPQLPFSELKAEFFGTDRAPLATPALCNAYQVNASFTPWAGGPSVNPDADFNINSGPNGSACTYPGQSLPFTPSLASGTPNINAGSFSSLATTLGREDGQQNISSVSLQYPPGLSGLLSNVKLCGEAEANTGTCGPESLVGETIVSVGLGNDPYSVTGGKVYITGPYQGAPFGLSIVNPAKAGPFDLQEGKPVIVRAKIEVNPITAALTVATNPAGSPFSIPTMIDGVPLQIKHVYVNITKQNFTFNPTSCELMKITSTIDSAEGASVSVSDPFQSTNCASLKYEPKVAVTTNAHTSKADGASLNFKISYPSGAMGKDAWFAKVKLDIPKQLPARLTTLQKACTEKQFETNPAGCPTASDIGHAIVHTEELPVPLEGPVYFVSHGGAKFPEVVMVLQGDNVTVDLHGETFISKTGVTSATFNAVPDAPFESVEVNIPTGPYSEFAANGNVCAETKTVIVKKKVTVKTHGHSRNVTRKVVESEPESLVMPTALVAQNGTEIHQNTPISVTGCPKAKAAKESKQKHTRGKKH
jgi:hypothetical protein